MCLIIVSKQALSNETNIFYVVCSALACKLVYNIWPGNCPNWRDITDFVGPCHVCLFINHMDEHSTCSYSCHSERHCQRELGHACTMPECYQGEEGLCCICFGEFCNNVACQNITGWCAFVPIYHIGVVGLSLQRDIFQCVYMCG